MISNAMNCDCYSPECWLWEVVSCLVIIGHPLTLAFTWGSPGHWYASSTARWDCFECWMWDFNYFLCLPLECSVGASGRVILWQQLWQCDSQTEMISRSMTQPFVCVNTTILCQLPCYGAIIHTHRHRARNIFKSDLNCREKVPDRLALVAVLWDFISVRLMRLSPTQTNSSFQHQELGIELSWGLHWWESDPDLVTGSQSSDCCTNFGYLKYFKVAQITRKWTL